jgi:hypothetical protein
VLKVLPESHLALSKAELRHDEEREHSDKKRLNICRKKQWHTFKVQDVKDKRRASLGLTTGVGSIFSVPSPSMGRRNVTS